MVRHRFPDVGNRLSKIYTRTGDDGSTGLGDGTRVGKDSARVDAYGTVDELNSALGVVLACEIPDAVRASLTRVQHELFNLGGELCIPGMAMVHAADRWAAEPATVDDVLAAQDWARDRARAAMSAATQEVQPVR